MRAETLRGAAITPHLAALARLRIEVFRDWPYLYDGDFAYERDYLQIYARAARAAVVFAFDADEVVGASTCLPLTNEPPAVQRPFVENGLDAEKYFYFGESVLKRSYRGRGMGVAFFSGREAHARSFGAYVHTTFCAVQRPDDHPQRPPDYVKLDDFWRMRGYARRPELLCTMSWLDIGEPQTTEKPLMFWSKDLRL